MEPPKRHTCVLALCYLAGAGGSFFTSPWFWILLLLVIAALVAAYFLLRRCRFKSRSKERQMSRQGVDRKLGGHRYMPLPADQQLADDMISQAASDAAWHQIASQPSKAPTSDASPMSGRGAPGAPGGWNQNVQSQWQLQQLPPTPRNLPMAAAQSWQGQTPGGWAGQQPQPQVPWQRQPPSDTQNEPNWMPHFLGAEAVREYDTWRTQRPEHTSWHAEMRPMLRPELHYETNMFEVFGT